MQIKRITKKLTSKIWRRHREYPIVKNEYGKSKRKQSFELFDDGLKPPQVIESVDISLATARRYYADWKKLPIKLDFKCEQLKDLLNEEDIGKRTIQAIADYYGMSVEQVTERLNKPWGKKQLIAGKWPNYKQDKVKAAQRELEERRMRVMYKLIRLYEKNKNKRETIVSLLTKHNDFREKILDGLLPDDQFFESHKQ
jgi:hypothetical protein